MGTHRAAHPTGTAQAQRRPSARGGSRGVDRDLLCAQDGHPMGTSAPRDGLRLRHDLLASPARLAGGRCLAEDLGGPTGRVRASRWDRLVHLGDGQLFGSRRFWGIKTGPNPTDRGKNGSKRHLIVDGHGTPLAVEHTAANVHESEMAIALIDGIPSIKQPRGRPRKRPDEVLADRAYDAEAKIRQPLRQRKVTPLIAKRRTEHGSGLGKYRYVVEAAFAWLFNQRRLRVRYEKRDDIHQAFLIIGCLLICWRRILRFC